MKGSLLVTCTRTSDKRQPMTGSLLVTCTRTRDKRQPMTGALLVTCARTRLSANVKPVSLHTLQFFKGYTYIFFKRLMIKTIHLKDNHSYAVLLKLPTH